MLLLRNNSMYLIDIIAMKKYLLILTLLLTSLTATAQTKIYSGAYPYSSKVLYCWDGKHLYEGAYAYTSKILYTWDGKHIYQGQYTYTSKILYTYDGKHLYRGPHTYTSDILLTTDGPLPPILFLLL